MAIQDVKYDAFISYRHTDLDQFVAQNLHHELEKFRLPKQLVKEHKLEKTKVERVFRDKEELTLANDLNNPLYHALVNSEYLIVICTPRLKDSEWCMKEIDTFIELHGKNRILLVLAEGEPDESFPEQLRFVEEEVTDEEGNVKKVRREVEPLAADVRGKNKSTIKKKIKEEIIRILAAMFQVNYDEIRQRHKEQKIRKTAMISLICSGVFLCVGAYSISTALQLRSQSRQIESQNKEIMGLMEELDEQYNKVQISYTKALSETANQLLANGERMEALYIARSVLHKEGEDGAEFNIPEAQKVLTNALYVYSDGTTYKPIRNYSLDSQVMSFELSKDDKEMVVLDKYDRFYVWNLITNEKQFHSEESSNNKYGFENEHILYSTKNGLYDYDLNTNINTLIVQGADYLNVSRDEKYYVYRIKDSYGVPTVYIADTKEHKVISECTLERDGVFYDRPEASFSSDGRTLLYSFENFGVIKSYLIDVSTGNIIASGAEEGVEHLSKFFIKNTKTGFLLCYSDLSFDEEFSSVTHLINYDMYSLEKLWQTETEEYFQNFTIFLYNDVEYIVTESYNKLYIFNGEDGLNLYIHEFDEGIVPGVTCFDNGYLIGFTKKGQMFAVNLMDMHFQDMGLVFNNSPGECADFKMVKGGIYYLPRNGRNVIYYELVSGRQQQILTEKKENVYTGCENSNATIYFSLEDNMLTMYEYETMKERFKIQVDVSGEGSISFIGNGEEYFLTRKWKLDGVEWTVYSSVDGTKINRFFVNGREVSALTGINSSGTIIYTNVTEKDPETEEYMTKQIAYDSFTGEYLGETPYRVIEENSYMTISDDMSVIAYIDRAEEEVSLFRQGEDKSYVKRKIPGISVGGCSLSPDGKYLACSDCYNKIILYDTKDLNWVTEIEEEDFVSTSIFGRIDELGVYYIKGTFQTYFLDDNGQVLESMEAFRGYDSEKKLLIQSRASAIYGYPYYTLDMLLDEADEVLKDYELPESIREKYGLEK